MSMSDFSSSSIAGDNRNFRQITRDRLLYEMLRSAKSGDSKSSWKVLIVDKVTVKIISCACKMADITEEGISLVEDIQKRRQPLPKMDAIYFIQPTNENVDAFMSDMFGKSQLYKTAYVFFSSPVSKYLVSIITKEPKKMARVGALREINLEYFAIDSQGFVTENGRALEDLFGDQDNHRTGDACLSFMAARIATVFASLRELPLVRYRAAKSFDTNTMTTYRDLVPTKLASGVWNCMTKYKKTIHNFPQSETCELLILDRSVDQIAPVIHEWTYGAMCHDLLNLVGNKYVVEVPSKSGGSVERKEALLDEHDPIWVELRDVHIADASVRLHEKMISFAAKNKAAAHIQHGSREGAELSTQELQRLVLALPQYREQFEKLSLHVEIAQKINTVIRERGLKDLGQLEQDLIFGDAGTKEIVKFLSTKMDTLWEDKLRLLLIYAAMYPEKLQGEKGSKLIQLARLSPDDMITIRNTKLLQAHLETKKSKGITATFSLKFDAVRKKRRAARKERSGEEAAAWQLSRFYPIIEDLVEKLCKGELPNREYPCINESRSPSFDATGLALSSQSFGASVGQSSVRTRRPTWARVRNSDDGYSSDSILRRESSEIQRRMGQRIFVFIVGGSTRSELRACHTLSEKLKREIILGSSSIDNPAEFIKKLKMLSVGDDDDISLDDIQI